MKIPNHGLGAKLTMATAAFLLAAASSCFAAGPTITWGTVANNVRTLPAITYGTRITSAAQLNAVLSPAGTVTYQINGATADNQLLNAGKSYKIILNYTSTTAGTDSATFEALIDVNPFQLTYATKAPASGKFERQYGDEKLVFAAGDQATVQYGTPANGESLSTVIVNLNAVKLEEVNSITVGDVTTLLNTETLPGTYAGGIRFVTPPQVNTNYELVKVNDAKADLVVNRRALNITVVAAGLDFYYGNTPSTVTYTQTGLRAGDADTTPGAAVPTGIRITPAFVGTVTSTTAAGDYAATALVSDGVGANAKITRYVLTVNNAKFSILKRIIKPQIYIKSDPAGNLTTKTIAYGDPNPVYELRYDNNGAGNLTVPVGGIGFAGTESSSAFTTAPAVVQPASLPNVATIAVKFTTTAAAANYTFDLTGEASLVVAARQVTVTGQNITRVFGGKNYAPAAVVEPTVAATAGAVGRGFAPHHSSINDIFNASGAVAPVFEGPPSTSNQGGDGLTDPNNPNSNPITPIGTYVGAVTLKSGTGTGVNSNYAVTLVNGDVIVTKVLANLDWSNFNSAALTYGDLLTAAKHFNATVKFNNVAILPATDMTGNGSQASTGAGVLRYTAVANTPANSPAAGTTLDLTTRLKADTYTITATFTPDATAHPSLAVTVATKVITVNKATLTVTTQNQEKDFGAALPTTTPVIGLVSGTGTTLVVTGYVFGETATTAGIDTALVLNYGSLAATSDVGEYPITYTGGAATKNYTLTPGSTGGKLKIKPITPVATWPDVTEPPAAGRFKDITYGTLLSSIHQGVVNSPSLVGTTEYLWVDASSNPAADVPYATAGLTVNNGALHTLKAKYTVIKNGAPDANYNVQTLTKTIKVLPKALALTAPIGKTSVFGSPIQPSSVSGTAAGTYLVADGVGIDGIVDNGVINDSSKILIRYTTSATRDDNAGSYPLTANLTDSANRLANYSLSIGSGTYTISKKPLLVKVKGTTAAPGVFKKAFLAAPTPSAAVPINRLTELSYVDPVTGDNGFVKLTAAGSILDDADDLDTPVTITVHKLGAPATTVALTTTTPVDRYGVNLKDAADLNYSFTYDQNGIYEITKIQAPLTWAEFAAIPTVAPFVKFGDTYAQLFGTSKPTPSRAVGDTATGAPGTVTVDKAFDSGYYANLDTWAANNVDASNVPIASTDAAPNKRKVRVTFTPNLGEVNYETYTKDYSFTVVKRKVNVTIDGMDTETLDSTGKPVKGGLTRPYGEFNRPFTVAYSNGEGDAATKKIFGYTDSATDFGIDVQPIPYSPAVPETAPGVYTSSVPTTVGTVTTPGYAVSFKSPGQMPADTDIQFVVTAESGEVPFTITKRKINISVEAKSRPYGSDNGVFTITGNNFGINNAGIFDTVQTKFSAQPQVVTAAVKTSSVGTYIVFVSGSASANYEITHSNSSVTVVPATPSFTWSVGGSIAYGTPLSAVQLNAKAFFGTTDISTSSGVFTYLDNAAGTIQNVGSKKLLANWTSSNANFASVTGINSDNELVVAPANLTAKAANSSITYGDAVPTAFAVEYGVFANPNDNANNVTAPKVTPDKAVTGAGTYALSVTPGLVGNYNIVPAVGGVLTVNPKAVTIVAKVVSRAYGASPVFDAAPYTVAGLVGTDSLGTDVVVSSSTAATANVGTYNLTIAGGQGNANYTVSYDGTGKLTVTPAPVTISVVNATKKYLDAVPVFELNIAPALLFSDSLSLINYTLDSSAVKADSVVGSYAVKITGAAVQGNYAVTFKDGTLTVEKATPTIAWSKPANVSYGSALGSAQLNAKAQVGTKDVDGTFTYTPAAGDTSLKAGTGRALSVSFAPTDTANYNSATGGTTIDVDKANPVITWSSLAATTYGSALGSSQLNASSSVAGTFTYNPLAGTVLTAGSQSLSASFTPTDADNYASASASNTLEVKKAAAVISADAKTKQFNAALPELTATIGGLVNGDAASVITGVRLATTATATSPIGSYPIRLDGSVSAANYDVSFVASTLTVTKATPSIVWGAIADITVGTALGDTQLNATSPTAGVFAYVPAKGTVLPLGNGQKIEAIFIPTDAVNYELVRAANTVNVTSPTVKPKNPADLNGDGLSDVLFQHTDGFLAAWFMDGANLKTATLLTPETAGEPKWEVVGYADFNGDGNGDILFQYNGGNFDGALAIWYMNGTTLTEAKLTTPDNPGTAWTAVAVGDFNGDKKADILFQHDQGFLALWYMNGASQSAASLLNPVAPFGADGTVDASWRAVATTDLNGDKKLDIVFQYSGGAFDRTVAVWYMDGINQSGAALLEPSNPGPGWSVVGSADYNNDGKADLLLQHNSGLTGVWYLDGVTLKSASLLNPESAGTGWRVVGP